jgi:hypothetical protein
MTQCYIVTEPEMSIEMRTPGFKQRLGRRGSASNRTHFTGRNFWPIRKRAQFASPHDVFLTIFFPQAMFFQKNSIDILFSKKSHTKILAPN